MLGEVGVQDVLMELMPRGIAIGPAKRSKSSNDILGHSQEGSIWNPCLGKSRRTFSDCVELTKLDDHSSYL